MLNFMNMIYRICLFIATGFISSLAGAATYEVPLGLPEVPWPVDNPYSKEKEDLGRILYFDKRLSSNQTISCASCHNIPCAYSDCRILAIGIDDTKGSRHSPTIINAAYSKLLFWDGRASSLEEQCKGPIGNPKEMTLDKDVHIAHHECVKRVQSYAGYRPLFKKAFGTDEITIDHISKAIATFERTILSGNSPYDKYKAGDKTAMTEEQIHGMKLFMSRKVGCANCHGGFNFTDERFLNIGVGMDEPNPDLGRYAITHNAKDWGAFKVPTLRESEHTAPYMHNGSHASLEEVIDYYDKGGNPNKNLHPLMKPLHLTAEEKQALVSFLKALSGEGWKNFKEPGQFPDSANGEIIEIQEIQSVSDYLQQGSLVLLNVGDTVFAPSSTLEDRRWREYFAKRARGTLSNLASAALVNNITSKIPPENETLDLIENLQKEKVPVLGYTKKFYSSFYSPHQGEITYLELLNRGVDFEKTFKYFPVKDYLNEDFAFKYGLIFRNKNLIGYALADFFKTGGSEPNLPNHVILVDSDKQALLHAEKILLKLNINFTGLLYNGEAHQNFDPTLGTIEFFSYVNEKKLLNDEEALQEKGKNREKNWEELLDAWIMTQERLITPLLVLD
jgi:cytochrome c peroxidase